MPSSLTRQDLINKARKVMAKKKLGQNFFVDPERLEKIIEAISPRPSDHVLEIGPGLGFLTTMLAETEVSKITAIELDRQMVDRIKDVHPPKVNVIHGDFLDCDIDSFHPVPNKIIGNVPYQITSPIIAHIFGEIGEPARWLDKIDCVVMTIQIEVAERLVAKPGSKAYSHLTILKEYLFEAETLLTVPPYSFYPVPEVTSAVVRLTPLRKPPINCLNMPLFKKIIASGFKQRRKMLKNNLAFLRLEESALIQIMRKNGINPSSRAEDLSIRQFATLCDALSEATGQPVG